MVIIIGHWLLSASLVLMVITVIVDVRSGRIPNIVLIFLVVVQGISEHISNSTLGNLSGSGEPAKRYLTILILLLLLYAFFSIGGLGAGDFKLIAVTVFRFSRPAEYMAIIFVLAALISLAKMFRDRSFYERMRVLADYLKRLSYSRKLIPYYENQTSIEEKQRHSIHLSIPISFAYCIMCLLEFVAS